MNKKNLTITVVLPVLLILTLNLNAANKGYSVKGKDPKTKLSLDLLFGYAFPINSSYIDTYVDEDIYWNPNSGIDFDLRLTIKFTDLISLTLPIDTVVGIYQYKTTDGRKINTEAQAGTEPITTNTEWSVAPNFAPMILLKPHQHPAVPYFGFGIGIAFLWSFESWEFINVEDQKAKLMMVKSYYPAPLFKGEIGWNVPVRKRIDFRIAATFNLANFIMYRVELTNYYIDGGDTMGNYTEKDRVYKYAFNAPDENKGGDCLLAGFTYQNYPQQKIGTNVAIKLGIAVKF